jgi:zinc transporter ZupT
MNLSLIRQASSPRNGFIIGAVIGLSSILVGVAIGKALTKEGSKIRDWLPVTLGILLYVIVDQSGLDSVIAGYF